MSRFFHDSIHDEEHVDGATRVWTASNNVQDDDRLAVDRPDVITQGASFPETSQKDAWNDLVEELLSSAASGVNGANVWLHDMKGASNNKNQLKELAQLEHKGI